MFRTIFAAGLLGVSSPALADAYFAVTPSGAAETVFEDTPISTISKLSSHCMDLKWSVVSSTSADVTCEAPMNTGQAVLGQLLMGNSYSTPPRRFFRFNVVETNGITRVQASGWMELQMAFGQMRRTDFSVPSFHNSAIGFMAAAGGKLPVGTTFPNHVTMGVQASTVATNGKQGLSISSVEENSSAKKAGMQVGDIVVAIAGKKFKNDDEYLDATAKAAKTPTYEVELIRNQKPLKLSLERAFRPAWTEQVVPRVTPASSPVVIEVASVADELAKLAKLKTEGVITLEEFEAQKKRLLGL